MVATASLELGIDMGAVDLVCQVESPGSVARGLQRVGRAGHLVGRREQGAADRQDVRRPARDRPPWRGRCSRRGRGAAGADRLPRRPGAAGRRLRGDGRAGTSPRSSTWSAAPIPYRDLTAAAFESVLKLVSGRFPTEPFRDLRARVSWDRVHNRLHALPGTARLALVGGGTIPDTGQYPVYLGDGGPRLGELDEEFVLERRVGETFVLGTATWRIEAIEPHRVVVGPAEGRSALMPFWRGEAAPRTAELGVAVGALCRELAERLRRPGVLAWLAERMPARAAAPPGACATTSPARSRVAGAVPDDRTVLVETFRDPAGELGLAVLSPFGGKLHQALKLALQGRLRERLGIAVVVPARRRRAPDPPARRSTSRRSTCFDGLTAEQAEALIRDELGDSALFGLRFRQNAGRALLMPRPDPAKRTPLWLQRLRAKDLLQVVRKFPDFPIVVETYRECLDDDLDLPRLRTFLDAIARGGDPGRHAAGRVASPFASDLIFRFTPQYLYQWDEPRRGDRPAAGPAVDEDLLDPLLDPDATPLLDPGAIGRVEGRSAASASPPRTADEMAETLRASATSPPASWPGRCSASSTSCEAEGRAVTDRAARARPSPRAGSAPRRPPLYASAFGPRTDGPDPSRTPLDDDRPPLPPDARPDRPGRPDRALPDRPRAGDRPARTLGRDGRAGPARPGGEEDAATLGRRGGTWTRSAGCSIAIRRRESVAVAPEVFADFVARRQHVHPVDPARGARGRRAGPRAAPGVRRAGRPLGDGPPAAAGRATTARPGSTRPSRPAAGLWRAERRRAGRARVAFVPRDFAGALARASRSRRTPLRSDEARGPRSPARRGASFATDLARALGPGAVADPAGRSDLLRAGW